MAKDNLKWAFGFPDGLVFDFQGWSNYVVATGILIFLISLATTVCRGLRRKNFEIWFGASWFLLTLIPVLFLRNVTMHHNLYIPVIGLALLVGLWLSGTYRRVARVNLGGARLIVAGFVLLMVGASAMHNLRAAEESWIAEASAVAKSSLDDLKNQRPRLSRESILYIVNDSPRDLRWFYDAGTLFRLFYQDPSLKVHFAERGDILPGELQSTAEVIVLVYDGERLRDVSLTEEDSVEQED